MTKAELRKIFIEKRVSLDPHKKMKLDDLMLIHFQRIYFEAASVLLSYKTIASKGEPAIKSMNRYLQHTIPGLRLCMPVMHDKKNCRLEAIEVTEETIYKKDAWGIDEPVNGDVVDAHEIDIVFVPMIVCDVHGYRVGYGKGYYDRYLARCREDVVTIGFSYFEPVEKIDDKHAFDVPLNYCVTPETVYEF